MMRGTRFRFTATEKSLSLQAAFAKGLQCKPLKVAVVLVLPGSPNSFNGCLKKPLQRRYFSHFFLREISAKLSSKAA
jgi:hypothetical protein